MPSTLKMRNQQLHVVTGAFGYSGRYIAHRLLARGHRVVTLTNSPDRANPFGTNIQAFPFHFDKPENLERTMRGADVLYNTYWVRFDYADFRQTTAVLNTLKLFDAARKAGVRRIVHVSITNPSEDSPLQYFRGKAQLERALKETGLSYAILRPTVLFGSEDVLINNIAWMLRRFPVFGVFGDGSYRLQPIYVDDLAKLAVERGASHDNCIVDAIGPETFTYRELVATIGRAIGKPRPIVPLPRAVGLMVGYLVGRFVGDVPITREEIEGLTSGFLCTDSPPAGHVRFSEWAHRHGDELGLKYASELARRRDRNAAYKDL
jgi:NADH dehydrogenase